MQGASAGGDSVDECPDGDKPEDGDGERKDAPEGYYEDQIDREGGYSPAPGDTDYDLSEAAGYAGYEPPKRRGIVPQWVIVAFTIALILAFVIPLFIRIS